MTAQAKINYFNKKKNTKTKPKLTLVKPAPEVVSEVPDIDVMRSRTIFAVLRAIKGMSPKEVEEKSKIGNQKGVCSKTIRSWYKPVAQGGVKYPSSRTLEAAAAAVGCELVVRKIKA